LILKGNQDITVRIDLIGAKVEMEMGGKSMILNKTMEEWKKGIKRGKNKRKRRSRYADDFYRNE